MKADAERTRYNELVAEINNGTAVERPAYDWAVSYARAKKIKLPPKNANIIELSDAVELAEVIVAEKAAAKTAAKKAPVKKAAAKKTAAKVPAKKTAAKAVNKGTQCTHTDKDGKPDCERDARSRKLCSMHHTAWYRANVPGAMEAARAASRRHAAKKAAAKKAAQTVQA